MQINNKVRRAEIFTPFLISFFFFSEANHVATVGLPQVTQVISRGCKKILQYNPGLLVIYV